jgi:5-methyltetrahydrofolate--homocysteine methyltransferase
MGKKLFQEISKSIFAGDEENSLEYTKKALADGAKPMEIINDGLVPGVNLVSDAFSSGEIFIPEMLLSAIAMQACLTHLKPQLSSEEQKGIGTIVIGTVLGDVHDIGKNLVSWLLEGAGFRVIDLGVDVPPDKFIQAINEENPEIVALSSLLTTSAHQIGVIIDYLEKEDLRSKVKVLIGGASVNQDFSDKVGADGYAIDAASGVGKAKELINN